MMGLLYKQLTRAIAKNRVFVILMLIITTFTTFMFYFVRFSIDGNITALYALPSLNEYQALYMNALTSNKILAFNFLIALTALTAFVFLMFFYLFFKANKKQIGCLKALGFKDRILCGYFMAFTVVMSFLGTIIGIGGGYFASSILLHANEQSYSVMGLVRTLHVSSILIGFLLPTITLCTATYFSYGSVRGKESGVLLAGINNELKYSAGLHLATTIVDFLPIKNKSSLRIALRKPVTVVLIVIAVMSFIVMYVLGYSLNISSSTVFKSQTEGHHYLYNTRYDQYLVQENKEADVQTYLSVPGTLLKKDNENKVEQQIIGLEQGKTLLSLVNKDGTQLNLPQENKVYIGPALQQLYGFNTGDTLVLTINDQDYIVNVHIAANATSNCVYLAKDTLIKILNLPESSYNGVLSMEPLGNGGTVTTQSQKLEELDRASVSNRSSAVINQVIGCTVGCILLYLALLLNFQDSTRDILILYLMGFKAKDIKRMLINIYKPILWLSFFITLWPGILLAQTIQKSLSIQTGDYMPFQINILIIGVVFILLNVIYFMVQASFNSGIRRVIKKEEISEYTNAD
jgi:putative ABC transport system permease protein